MLQLAALDENDDDYYEDNLTLGVVASNHSIVAEFASTTDNAVLRITPTYPCSNLGFAISTSNISPNASSSMSLFSIGEVVHSCSNNSSSSSNGYSNCELQVWSDFIIKNHNIGINTNDPQFTLDVCGVSHLSSNLVVDGPILQIPGGSTVDRPDMTGRAPGAIRYNTEINTFEGYGPGDAWGSLGGVINVSQTTYIKAELTPGSLDNNLRMVTSNAERLRISSNGYVGIGTSSPQCTLDVHGPANFSSNLTVSGPSFVIPVGGTSERPSPAEIGNVRYNTDISSFEGFGPGDAWGTLGGVTDVARETYISAELYPGSADCNLRMFTANSERMRVTPDGSVGIGTTAPAYTLDVNGTGHFASNIIVDGTIDGYVSSNQPYIISLPYVNSIASLTSNHLVLGSPLAPTIVNSGFQVNGNAVIAGTLTAQRVRIGMSNTVTSIVGNLDTVLSLSSQALITTLSNVTVENMTVTSNLEVLGVTNIQSNINVFGTMYAYSDIFTMSDKTIKTDLIKIADPLEKIGQLNGYTYERIDKPVRTRESGLLAQDVLRVMPELVKENPEGLYSVAYGNLAGLFVEAFKEMQQRIEKLESQISNVVV